MSIRIRVLLFGPAATMAGSRSVELDLAHGATVVDLRRALSERCAALARGLGTMRIAVNQAFADDSLPLQRGDEAAVIPPVSGG